MKLLYEIGEKPTPHNIEVGEEVYNVKDEITYTKDKWNNIIVISSGGGGGGDILTGSDKNKFINGGFKIWQRGETHTNTLGECTADRWECSGNDVHKFLGSETDFMVVTNHSNWSNVGQKIEQGNIFKGSTCTFSFDIGGAVETLTEAYVDIQLSDGSFYESHTMPTLTDPNIDRHSLTVDIPDDGTQERPYLQVQLVFKRDSAIVVGDIYISKFQFEFGATVTPFEERDIGLEELLCYRYFYRKIDNRLIQVAPRYNSTTNFSRSANVTFPIPMRATPTITNITANEGWNSSGAIPAYIRNTGLYFYGVAASALSSTTVITYTADAEL